MDGVEVCKLSPDTYFMRAEGRNPRDLGDRLGFVASNLGTVVMVSAISGWAGSDVTEALNRWIAEEWKGPPEPP